jgi:hypothetical protein
MFTLYSCSVGKGFPSRWWRRGGGHSSEKYWFDLREKSYPMLNNLF